MWIARPFLLAWRPPACADGTVQSQLEFFPVHPFTTKRSRPGLSP